MKRGGDGIWTMVSLTAQHSRLGPGEAPLRFQGAVCCGPFVDWISSAVGASLWKSLLICLPCLLSQGMEQSQNQSSDRNKRLVVIHVLPIHRSGFQSLGIFTSPNPADVICAKHQILTFLKSC